MVQRRIKLVALFLAIILAGQLGGPVWARPPGQGSIILGLEPMVLPVVEGEEFDLQLFVESETQPIDGVQATMAFDPAYLSVIEMSPGDVLPDTFPPPSILPNGFSNSEGRISFAAGKLFGDLPSGRFTVLTIRVQALGFTTGTLMQFIDDPRLPTSKVTAEGENLGINLVGSVITINPSGAATSTPSLSPTTTQTRTPSLTFTPEPTSTLANEPTSTATSAAYPGPAQSPTATWTPSPSPTHTPTETLTETPTETATWTATSETVSPPSDTPSPTDTARPQDTETPTPPSSPVDSPTSVPPTETPMPAASDTAMPPITETQAAPGTDSGSTNYAPEEESAASPQAEELSEVIADAPFQPPATPDTRSLVTRALTDNIWGTMAIVAIALSVLAFVILRREVIAPDEEEEESEE